IIKIKKVGKTKTILLNTLNPVTFSLRQLFDYNKLLSLPESKISAILFFKQKTYEDTKAIVLFGSLVAGTYNEKSDIDLLVITDNEKQINKDRGEISELTKEKINVHFLKPADAKKEFKENDLIRNAIASGILIYGGFYIREIIREQEDFKELEFLEERINAAWRNYANKDYESAKEILSAIYEDMAFLACRMEGLEALSRKDATSKIKKLNDFKILVNMNKLKIENQLGIVEDIYAKLFNRIILKGEGIERRIEK
ncbi:MAG: nucleotidyltransferase domain-containing protein, partial [Nanoarchaeota archaeon]|nr:nucleotidyltransferase domain-containing protein [Nanoarchaeota archaeon]